MEGTVYLLGVDRAALLLSGIKPVLQSQSVQFPQPKGRNWVVCALERQLGVWLRVLPFHTVPSSLVTETVSGTKLSEGELCHPRPFEPEFCAVVVIRPEELKKNRPNVPFHPRLRDISGREMAAPFNFSV